MFQNETQSQNEASMVMGDLGRSNPTMMDVDMLDISAALPPVSIQNTNLDQSNNVGAGPLPTGWGQPAQHSSSTLTDFTKRRNWSKLVLDQLRDVYMVLSPELRIIFISPSCSSIGYDAQELKSTFLPDYVHLEDKAMVIKEINECIASQHQMRFFYRFRTKDDSYQIFEAFGHPHFNHEGARQFSSDSGVRRSCGGVFFMNRPYPTKNAKLLDSLLEHKIEHERLLRKIAVLKREEKEEIEQHEQLLASRGAQSSKARSELGTETQTDATSIYDGMPPPPKPTESNTALTKQNLNEALASSRPDSINDKMARYEGASPTEHIEMLTGLRHGERSEGISTGAFSPALIKGDAGIAILADRENRSAPEKKKKSKVADEYVCTDCGTLDSPEWRKGPQGPKTLCNACGLRWAKKEKKRQDSYGGPSQSHTQTQTDTNG